MATYPRIAEYSNIIHCFSLRRTKYHEAIKRLKEHRWLKHCATSRKVAGSISEGVIGIFNLLNQSFQSHYGPGVDSASNRNEYQEYFPGGKGGRCLGLTNLSPSCADCLEIWEPQPPGTLGACQGL
jgi:hypothetical protein